jgi:hypothetical protein
VGAAASGPEQHLRARTVATSRSAYTRRICASIDGGVFAAPSLGPEEFGRRALWFLDGLSMSLLNGSPRLSREDAVDIGLAELERPLF